MPTGYTAPIYEGEEMSGKEFILRCARAFGATIMMRDEPLNKEIPEFEPNNYHKEQLKKAKEKLVKYQNISNEEAQKIIDDEYMYQLESYHERLQEKNELLNRYTKVLNEVKDWIPPTEDHVNLKEYAVNQLEESIKFDCNTDYIEKPIKKSVDEWLQTRIESCKRDINYHKTEWDEEVKRTKDRNKWVRALR